MKDKLALLTTPRSVFYGFTVMAASLALWSGHQWCSLPASTPVPREASSFAGHRAPSPATSPDDRQALSDQPSIPGEFSSAHGRPKQRIRSYERLGTTLAAEDPSKALETLGTITAESERRSFIHGFITQLAQGDPTATLDLIKRMKAQSDQDVALLDLMEAWKADDPVSPVRQALYIEEYGLEAGLGLELLDGSQPNVSLATLWANRLDESENKAHLLAAIADQVLVTDPTAALALGADLTGNNYVLFVQQALESWARIDPQAAADWAARMPDPAIREAVQGSIAFGWTAMDDTQVAMNALATMPPGTARNDFIKVMAERQARLDPDGAIAWANALSDPTDRNLATNTIQALPGPVTGIGARLDTENSMPIVSSVIGESPAALSGQIHEGDRIVAVAQGDGNFVNTQGMDLTDIVDMIRGTASTTVQLQITSPQPGGFGPPHVVQLARQQIRGGS